MNSKLTLTIEYEVIGRAKKYASRQGRSVSDIVENYLKVITQDDISQEVEITPLIKSLKGSFRAPDEFDYRKELGKALSEKYLKDEKRTD